MNLLHPTLKLKGFPLEKARIELKRIQSFDQCEFEKWQESRKWEMFIHHFTNNSLYAAKNKHYGGSKWEELPVMTKLDFQSPLASLISKPCTLKNVYVGNTSGSSGHPFYYAKDKFSHAMTYALIENRYEAHGLGASDRQARFYGIPLSGKSRLIEKVKDFVADRTRFPVFDLSDLQLQTYLRKLQKTKFDYVYGYTSALVLFAKFLLKQNILLKDACPSLKACVVTSEVCTFEDRGCLSKAFGIPVINEYGASELDIIAFEDQDGDWVLSEENLFIEVLDNRNCPVQDGEEGKIVITSLHNKAMPFVRYEIGDMGAIERKTKSRLLKLSGRTNDTILLPSGRKAAGLTFYYISRSILESSGVLKEFIIRQVKPDTFVFDVVTERPLSKQEELEIQRQMDIYLEKELRLIINRVEKIDRPASGKIKHFYSQLQ